jgi:hypothetical protein
VISSFKLFVTNNFISTLDLNLSWEMPQHIKRADFLASTIRIVAHAGG